MREPLLAFFLLTSGLTHAADFFFTLGKPGNVSGTVYDAQGRAAAARQTR